MNQVSDPDISNYYSYLLYPEPVVQRETRPEVLAEILKKAQEFGSKGAVIFDIDSTIYDNRPREARIIREFGKHYHLPVLLQCGPEHIRDRSLLRSMVNCGLPQSTAEELEHTARSFWFERFLTNEYCLEDRPLPGAIDYLCTIKQTDVQIFYCTGRPEAEMGQGTLQSLQRDGFPVPDEKQTFLLMKPTFFMTDDESKLFFYQKLEEHAVNVLAAFDNEPLHINGYHEKFPEALAVHLLTEESGRGIPVHPSIPSIRNFFY